MTINTDDSKERVEPVDPSKNYRRTQVRCCGTCRYLAFPGNGAVECRRPAGPVFDAGDQEWWGHVCDGFVRHIPGRNDL